MVLNIASARMCLCDLYADERVHDDGGGGGSAGGDG